MTPGVIVSIVIAILVAIGLGVTWIRNDRSQAKRDGILEERINGVKDKLEDPNTGLGAIKNSVERQAKHCAGITSAFEERLKDLEKD
ncbi:hypothetical protein ES703_28109 [subsurface metagenome]